MNGEECFDETSYRLYRQEFGKDNFRKEKEETPACIALSGGIDSCAILAMAKHQYEDIRSYSIGFDDSNEFVMAEAAASYLKVNHKSLLVTREEYMEKSKEIIQKKGYPLQVPNETLLYMIAEQFKEDTGGGDFLSGEGGDELFGGYTNVLETIPNKRGDLIENYLYRLCYDKGLMIQTGDKKYKEFYKSCEECLKTCESEDKFDQIQHLLLNRHFPALWQRLKTVELVDGVRLVLPFTQYAWYNLHKVLPKEFKTNKTFLRLIFRGVLPNKVLDGKKIGFPLPIHLKKWQDWNVQVFKNGESKINFWKD